VHNNTKILSKLGTDALAPDISEAKAITSDEFCKIHNSKKAFTLIEVLISIAILGFVILVLFRTLDMARASNTHLFNYLQKSTQELKGIKMLYLDILKSDGNLTIKQDDFTRFCIEDTTNSLYGLNSAKVCWIIAKEDNRLLRIEGNNYKLPASSEAKVEIDEVMKDITHFYVARNKDRVLVILDSKGSTNPISFMVQGVMEPIKKKKKKKKINNHKKRPLPSSRPIQKVTPTTTKVKEDMKNGRS